MTKFKKQNALPCKFQKKKNSKARCFIVEKFQIINTGEAILPKSILKPLGFFVKILTKSVRKLEKLKWQNFKKCMFEDPIIINTAFS